MSHTVYRSRTGYNERHVDPSRTRCPGTHPAVPVLRRFVHRPALRRPAHRLLGLGLPARPVPLAALRLLRLLPVLLPPLRPSRPPCPLLPPPPLLPLSFPFLPFFFLFPLLPFLFFLLF